MLFYSIIIIIVVVVRPDQARHGLPPERPPRDHGAEPAAVAR